MNKSNQVSTTSEKLESVFLIDESTKSHNQKPVFFVPKEKINSPFEDMFIPANIGLERKKQGKFVFASIDIPNEPNVYRARSISNRSNCISYLVANII